MRIDLSHRDKPKLDDYTDDQLATMAYTELSRLSGWNADTLRHRIAHQSMTPREAASVPQTRKHQNPRART